MSPSISSPAKINLTAFQKELHAMSTKQGERRGTGKTRGAFGGCTRDERALRSIKRRLA